MCEFFSIEKKRAQGIGFCKILKIFFIFPSEKNQKSFRDNCFWFWFNKNYKKRIFSQKEVGFRWGFQESLWWVSNNVLFCNFESAFRCFLCMFMKVLKLNISLHVSHKATAGWKEKTKNRNMFFAHRAVFQERAPKDDYKFTRLVDKWIYGNDPSAGSPTETLLRLLLPLNDQVWASSHRYSAIASSAPTIPRSH